MLLSKKVKVSIVLPVYNGERFLEQSVNSIINQSFKNWELIIVDDCSTDNSLKIAKSFAAKDSRITVIHNLTNKKLPETLNVGFAMAKGEYFTWTSDDNVAKSNWLETLVGYLDNNPDVDMVSATMDYINEENKFLYKAGVQKTPAMLAYRCNVGAAFMYRKTIAEKVGKYDTNTFCAEDYDYWCRIALKGNLVYIPDNIYSYRLHSDSLTASCKSRIRQKTMNIQDKYRTVLNNKFKPGYVQRSLWEYLTIRRKYKLIFVLFDIYTFLLKNMTNLVLFWNKKLRRKVYDKFRLKIII